MSTLTDIAERTLIACRGHQLTLATAESCTGGMVSTLLTSIAGSSDVVECGFVTYSNRAKQKMLGVPAPLLEQFGAVSAEVARAMADGALEHSAADISVSITGIAGPDGGSAQKPVGLVHFATARRGKETRNTHHVFSGNRTQVRKAAARFALELLLERAGEEEV